ncbi:MAG: deoxyribonuclease V [Thermanaerothrix sp.]|nr:deoxyribonuclease V [Thermanaerothrix sp.]
MPLPLTPPHEWNVTPDEAIALQNRWRERVIREDRWDEIRAVAGVDVGFEDEGRIARAAVVVLDFPTLMPRQKVLARKAVTFPYIPGLLSFREMPVILEALAQLEVWPDVLLVDGQGIAHPRRLGIASHLGIWCDVPSVGVAKSRLIGWHASLDDEVGAWQPLWDGDEIIGAALRTRKGARPVYVSIGHRVRLNTALDLVLRCGRGYRLAEPLRLAHQYASQWEKS